MNNSETTGLYLHIPFCSAKCHYCDFYSQPYRENEVAGYVDALLHQLHAFDRSGHIGPVDTVYLGGGTPSILPVEQTGRLLDRVFHIGRVMDGAEITMEVNPESCSFEYFSQLRSWGVNRLSVGVQSSFDDTLSAIGRRHTYRQAENAVTLAARAGFDNISADLMIGLPGQDGERLQQTLEKILQLPLVHISAYILKLSPETMMGGHPPDSLPDDDGQAELYETACRMLREGGFVQYEISNFAHPGSESLHNTRYWDCRDYLGLGPAAHSSLQGTRYSFPSDLRQFTDMYRSLKH